MQTDVDSLPPANIMGTRHVMTHQVPTQTSGHACSEKSVDTPNTLLIMH